MEEKERHREMKKEEAAHNLSELKKKQAERYRMIMERNREYQ